jgi:thioredoxin 2
MSFSIIRTCVACGQRNRIPAEHLADTGRCGACKRALPPHSEPINVDAMAFAEIVGQATVPIFIDFWAGWCGPCLLAAPEVKRLAIETAGKALILKVNTDDCPQLSTQFSVQSIPTFVVLRGGRAVFQQTGLFPCAEMRRWVEAAVVQS